MERIEQQALTISGPHNGQPVYRSGEPLYTADAAIVMMHGRGASADDMLGLAETLAAPGLAILAPEAAGNVWYPYVYSSPTSQNEPYLSSALDAVGAAVAMAEAAGIPAHNIILLGFSQGACLALEYAARNGRHYGGVVGLSGVLIGTDDGPRSDNGCLDGTPVFLGCGDIDPYFPVVRVERAAAILEKRGGSVIMRIFRGMGHTVNDDEIGVVRGLIKDLQARK
jgi:predicted esterase